MARPTAQSGRPAVAAARHRWSPGPTAASTASRGRGAGGTGALGQASRVTSGARGCPSGHQLLPDRPVPPPLCAQHQLCLLHLQRKLERGLSREGMRRAREALFRLRRSRDREEGRGWLGELAAVVASDKPALARQLGAWMRFLTAPCRPTRKAR